MLKKKKRRGQGLLGGPPEEGTGNWMITKLNYQNFTDLV